MPSEAGQDRLTLLGGTPVRADFPPAPPRLRPEELAEIRETLLLDEWSRAGDDWPLAPVDRLEAAWSAAHGVPHAVAVSSGTAALTLTLRALEIPAGDEILIPAYGCPAVDVAVLEAGLTPVHVDLDPRTYCLSAAAVAAAVTPRTAAILPVHFAGQPAGLGPLSRIAERHGLALVEDACLAPGAAYEGTPVGTGSTAAVFSLGVRKPISAGEGGLVVTGDASLAERLRQLRSLGADADTGDITVPSGNSRMSALAAAVVLPQLARREADGACREESVGRIIEALKPFPFVRPLERDPRVTRHAWAQLWLRYDEEAAGVPRARVVDALQAEGIPLFAGWPRPNHTLGLYTADRAGEWLRARGSGRDARHYERTHCPHAERAAFGEALLLDYPILAGNDETVRDTAAALVKVFERLDALRSAPR